MRIHILCVLSPVFLVMLLKHNERELQRNSSFPIIKHKNSFNRAKLFFFFLSPPLAMSAGKFISYLCSTVGALCARCCCGNKPT